MLKIARKISISVAFFGLLTACGQKEMATGAGSANQQKESATENHTDPSEAAGVALKKENVAIKLAVVGAPTYVENEDTFHQIIKITNDGKAALPAHTTMPVRLGAVLVDPNGGLESRVDIGRANLPNDIAPGQSADVDVAIEGSKVVNDKQLHIEALQENVAWFSVDFQQPDVVVGTFARCNENTRSICDSKGVALSSP